MWRDEVPWQMSGDLVYSSYVAAAAQAQASSFHPIFLKENCEFSALFKKKCSPGGDMRKDTGQLANYLGLGKDRLNRQHSNFSF